MSDFAIVGITLIICATIVVIAAMRLATAYNKTFHDEDPDQE